MRSIMVALTGALLLGACSQPSEETLDGSKCNFVTYPLENALPDEPDLASVLADSPGDILLLSGGSQDGAFGTGFIDGWHESGTMPDFKLVTGISTGALQSTGAFIKQPGISVDGYTIETEADLLDTYVDGDDIDPEFTFGAIYTLLTKGSIADLIPLRDELDRILTPEILRAVAERYETEDALLLAGATDVDLGVAVAFDLTEMAARYADATDSVEQARWKDCYIRALAASSIVPPAAKPVFIDNRMYIDGGIRYAVFDDRMSDVQDAMIEQQAIAPPPPPPAPAAAPARPGPPTARTVSLPMVQAPRMFMILNATGDSRAQCRRLVGSDDCTAVDSTEGPREDWEVLPLALRTLELFENQVRRLSVERAESRARETNRPFYFARIQQADLDDETNTYAIPDFEGAMNCTKWQEEDDDADNPIEFHKRYMRCLIEYGRERGLAAGWDTVPGGPIAP